MILRVDQLPIELPIPANPSPNGAAAVQELLGGRFGEMSTLMNYTMQSFNFRGRDQARPYYDFIASGQQALPIDSMGQPWTGQNVFSSGNLKLDLLHNFFLECGARANKIRVYEMATEPTARALTGFLLVRGGVHIVAYAKALEKLSGVAVGKLLPIPDISNKRFPESKKHEERGLHQILYRFNA